MATKQSIDNQLAAEKEALRLQDIKIGYVMPIAKTEGYPDSHWSDVMNIISDTLTRIGARPGRMVSDGGEITTIHSRIVNNLNDDDLIICDVSSRNPNVMFELGMRIAFDKPVIIIKDDVTDYCFDSGTIEHIGYPKDLRHGLINKFQNSLATKINATFEAFIKNKTVKTSPILKNFGSYDKKDIKLEELSANEILIKDIQSIKNTLVSLQMMSSTTPKNQKSAPRLSDGTISMWTGNNASVNLSYLDPICTSRLITWLDEKNYDYIIENGREELNVRIINKEQYKEMMSLINSMRN